MKKIIVSQRYLNYIKENMDVDFFGALKDVFMRFDKHIETHNDALLLMKNSSNVELNNNVFELLEQFPEKKTFIYDLLYVSKYSRTKLAEKLIKDVLNTGEKEYVNSSEINNAWFFCDTLRQLKVEAFFFEYVKILNNEKLGTSRQPIVELLSYFKKRNISEILLAHITDNDINGHILDVLIKIKSPNLSNIAENFLEDERDWVRKLAQKSLIENS